MIFVLQRYYKILKYQNCLVFEINQRRWKSFEVKNWNRYKKLLYPEFGLKQNGNINFVCLYLFNPLTHIQCVNLKKNHSFIEKKKYLNSII